MTSHEAFVISHLGLVLQKLRVDGFMCFAFMIALHAWSPSNIPLFLPHRDDDPEEVQNNIFILL